MGLDDELVAAITAGDMQGLIQQRNLSESQRALIAAELSPLGQGQHPGDLPRNGRAMNAHDAAALFKVSPAMVYRAKLVLREGSTEEIAAVRNGTMQVSTLSRKLQRGFDRQQRRHERERALAARGRNPERIERQRMVGQLWADLRDPLIRLTGLPLPAEVAEIIRTSNKGAQTAIIDARLDRALKWLQEFAHAWHSNRG